MKKYVFLFSCVAMFMLGNINMVAQSINTNSSINELTTNDSNNETIKLKCQALKELLDLSEKQEYAVMRVLKITEPKKIKIEGANYVDKVQAKKDLQSVLEYESEKFKQILSSSQFEQYLNSIKR